MKILDHLPLKKGICQSKCKKLFCLKFPKDIFFSLREQNNYKRLFSQALPKLHYSPTLPPSTHFV